MGKKKLKIAFLNIYQGKVERGAENFINELSKRLLGEYEVDLISGRKETSKRWPILWRAFLDRPGMEVFWFTLKNLRKVWKEKYGIVIPINGGWQPALIRIATWLYGGKMVISGHSGIGWDDRNNLWCFPDCFVAITSKAEKWARKANPFVRVEYIPNGVDLDIFRPEGEKLKIGLKRPVVLSVGALTSSKRISLVIEAVSQLKNVSYLVIGGGELRQEIVVLGKRLLGERFELISLKYKDMPKAYRATDILCLVPWEREAFGITYLEAMASGLPVVAPKDEQRKEIVGDGGLLVENPENVSELSETINKALKIKWGEKPRRQAMKFDWDKIASEYERLFEELIRGREGG